MSSNSIVVADFHVLGESFPRRAMNMVSDASQMDPNVITQALGIFRDEMWDYQPAGQEVRCDIAQLYLVNDNATAVVSLGLAGGWLSKGDGRKVRPTSTTYSAQIFLGNPAAATLPMEEEFPEIDTRDKSPSSIASGTRRIEVAGEILQERIRIPSKFKNSNKYWKASNVFHAWEELARTGDIPKSYIDDELFFPTSKSSDVEVIHARYQQAIATTRKIIDQHLAARGVDPDIFTIGFYGPLEMFEAGKMMQIEKYVSDRTSN
jgi:hypothetical protein